MAQQSFGYQQDGLGDEQGEELFQRGPPSKHVTVDGERTMLGYLRHDVEASDR